MLDDGGEVDLDLGNYERFLDVTLQSDNNITTGKIYQDVISRERRGDYLGKTVQGQDHLVLFMNFLKGASSYMWSSLYVRVLLALLSAVRHYILHTLRMLCLL